MTRRRTLLLPAALLLWAAADAAAQPEEQPGEQPDEQGEKPEQPDQAAAPVPLGEGGIPPDYERVELVEKMYGVRDDTTWTLEISKRGTVYLGTMEGRAYISTDFGETWRENWVVPEVRSLYGFAGQPMLLGSLRPGNPTLATFGNLTPGWGPTSSKAAMSNFSSPGVPFTIDDKGGIGEGMVTDEQKFSYRVGADPGAVEPLRDQATGAALQPGVVLGAALSVRAPRLALLLTVRGRPIANVSMQRLLLTVGLKQTEVRKIIEDPKDPQHLMAATINGLYQSYDGGVSWLRTFVGQTIVERPIIDLIFDPQDGKRVYMGSQRGLFISDDSGNTWAKSTTVPEIFVKKIAFDPRDSKKIYIAGTGGVYRSDNRGRLFQLSFFSAIPRWNDVMWITIDPNNPEKAYLGTGGAVFATEKLSTSTVTDWRIVQPLRFEGLVIPIVIACSKHPGHLYMMTRADLFKINYDTNGPESYLLETWDDGKTWRVLAGNRTAGDVRWFTVDPNDPDQPWVAFSRALVQIKRVPASQPMARPLRTHRPVLNDWPSLTDVELAAARYHKIGPQLYQDRLDLMRAGNWLPSRLNVTFFAGRSHVGSDFSDRQFAPDRILRAGTRSEWRMMAYLTWRLPDIYYEHRAVTMQRIRELMMNDEVRNKIMITIQRNYGEFQRLKARQRSRHGRDLYTRAVEQSRMDQLEAIVNVASGNFLNKWRASHGYKTQE